jgi:hypothetical protein
MVNTPGWQEVIKPFLESKIQHLWVDPTTKDDTTLLYEYKLGWAFAKAANEILELIDKLQEEAEMITKKEKGELKDKLREAVS